MGAFLDLAGRRFGRLVALKVAPRDKPAIRWICKCDCGARTIVYSTNLVMGRTISCGCRKDEGPPIRHGMCSTRTYHSWTGMKARCLRPTATRYKDWGGRGIGFCEEWRTFDRFFADMGECPDGYSLERIDNSKGYSKQNCYWATPKEQANNSRKNRRLRFAGRNLNIVEWSALTGLKRTTITQRIDYCGWSIRKALTTPVMQRKRRH